MNDRGHREPVERSGMKASQGKGLCEGVMNSLKKKQAQVRQSCIDKNVEENNV